MTSDWYPCGTPPTTVPTTTAIVVSTTTPTPVPTTTPLSPVHDYIANYQCSAENEVPVAIGHRALNCDNIEQCNSDGSRVSLVSDSTWSVYRKMVQRGTDGIM